MISYIEKIVRIWDDDVNTPYDYTIMISNLPKNITKNKIKEWLIKRQIKDCNGINIVPRIRSINMTYHISGFVEL